MEITRFSREPVPNEWKDWEDTFTDEMQGFWAVDSPAFHAPAAHGNATTASSSTLMAGSTLTRSSLSSSSLNALDLDLGLDASMMFPGPATMMDDPLDSLLLSSTSLTPSFGSFTDLLAIGSPLPDVQELAEAVTPRPAVRTPPPEPHGMAIASPTQQKVSKKAPAVAPRKRKMTDDSTCSGSDVDKRTKSMGTTTTEKRSKRSAPKLDDQTEKLYRKRFETLHEILEAWNTGGIEDMEEIAPSVYHDDITLVSPDYSEGLCGVKPIMEHWNLLLDAFPDGIMEEYDIERDDPAGERMRVSWVFSGTQIFPFFGVQPRHQKVTIRGSSYFTFKGEKISQMVLSWNYREALMQLMGVTSTAATNNKG